MCMLTIIDTIAILQLFAFKPATNNNIKPIAGLRPATLLVAGLINNCYKSFCVFDFAQPAWNGRLSEVEARLNSFRSAIAVISSELVFNYDRNYIFYRCDFPINLLRILFDK